MSFEGPLSKWTNVIQGWQYRFCVVDGTQGILIYYTSKENMIKSERRGVVLLKNAHLGINSEDDSTFTIRSHGKTFHFQARDGEERQKWISKLEDVICLCSTTINESSSDTAFQRKITEADNYLQLLISQITELEELNNQFGESNQEEYSKSFITSAKKVIETVKHSIVALQLAKIHMESNNESKQDNRSDETQSLVSSSITNIEINENVTVADVNKAETSFRITCPVSSYSSSDEETDFYDAPESADLRSAIISTEELVTTTMSTADAQISFDDYEAACVEEPETDLESVDGNIIMHLISQARISADLTKITLPTFILERRSFLEMLADFLAHPDEFVNITNFNTPRERFIQVVRWYLSAFHAGRKSPVPKKPYNPILGEIFQCLYEIDSPASSNKELAKSGPVPWASDASVTFIAEQTSHHPPIASFYAECPEKRIQVDGCLWTKSKFLGLSIGVHMIGNATITLIDHGEDYTITFPSAYGRSILTVPWFEMGGKVSIECPKTGYTANIEFLTKPIYSGKKHQIIGSLYEPDKKEFCKIDGEWNGVMNARYADKKTSEVFFDTKTTSVTKKTVRPIIEQDEKESRRLWKDVTYYLKSKQLNKATEAKSFLEQRQRNEARERTEKSIKWETKNFMQSGTQTWTYANKLINRLE